MRRLIGSCVAVLSIFVSTISAAAPPVPEDLGIVPGQSNATPFFINGEGRVTGLIDGRFTFSWTQAEGMRIIAGPSSPNGFAVPAGINDSGQIVGVEVVDGQFGFARAFSLTPTGALVDLGTLGGSYAEATAVNQSGLVVGHASVAGGSQGFVWTTETPMRGIGTLGGPDSRAEAVNASGHVVGWSNDSDFKAWAFLWTPETGMRSIADLGGVFTVATKINDHGQVIGFGFLPNDTQFHAFSWTEAGGLRRLEAPEGVGSVANALNNSGQVVGTVTLADGRARAFLWTEAGGMVDLGTLGGSQARASAINASGHVVGSSLIAGNLKWHAFLWTPAGGMVDLGPLPGFDESAATHLNDRGEIVGTSSSSFPVGPRATLWRESTARAMALGPANTWVGLKNSDDVGIRFDLRAEVYRNATELVGFGEVQSVAGGSSGFNAAKQDTITLTPMPGVVFNSSDTLSVRLLVRNACTGSGKNSGTARLWFNDSAATSRFDATIGGAATYFLRNGFGLGTAPGQGPKQTIDVAAGAKCSPFKAFGTWSTTMP